MYVENQYIYDQFVDNFIKKTSGKIVIYGTGVHTELLLKKINSKRIVGLMDLKRTGETLWGYKVLSYEEVASIPEVYIVVIARNAVINVIYHRIEVFIKDNGIVVYDVNGNNLSKNSFDNMNHDCFRINEQVLKEKIKKADVITFDIFDTLITRCIMRPKDIFFIMDKNLIEKDYCFSSERIRAEEDANKSINPTIYEIYKQFQKNTKISDREVQQLIDLEIKSEKQFLIRREKMCQLLEESIKLGKDVYLISDMYFTKEILIDLLNYFHITGYKNLYVSCENRSTKVEGLFEVFIEKENIKKKKCLHIGDNYYADIQTPNRLGMDTFQVYSVIEMLESSIYSMALVNACSLEENIVLAYFAANAYNNPFCSCKGNGKLILNSTDQVVKFFVAPVIFKFMSWFIKKIKEAKCDYVIFPSRDGFILQKIYEYIKNKNIDLNLPSSSYLYTSRRSALVAAAREAEDVKNIISIQYNGSKAECIKDRFNIDIDDTDRGELSSELFISKALLKCKEERKNYQNYLSTVISNQYKNIAFVDFVAMGTVQDALQRITYNNFSGYYFLRRSPDNSSVKNIDCYSLYGTSGDFQSDANIYKYYYFLETIVTSYEPTFKCIDHAGNKVFYKDRRNEKDIEILKKIHKSILEYCKDMYNLIPDITKLENSVTIYDNLLGFFSTDYSEFTNQKICNMVNVDEFMGKIVTEINR